MKNKSNKEIIEEFREKFVDKDKKYIVDYIDGVMVTGADIEQFILQALEQKEREVEEKYTQRVRELEKANKSLSKVALKNY